MRRLVEGLTIAGILAACGGGDVATSSSTGTGGTGATGAAPSTFGKPSATADPDPPASSAMESSDDIDLSLRRPAALLPLDGEVAAELGSASDA